MGNEFDRVQEKGRGERDDYRLEPRPLSQEGGQADVFRATHKPTDVIVAFKRIRNQTSESIARMRREIDVGAALEGTPNVMPVLDSDPDHTWFVMPLAEGNAQDFASELRRSQESLRELVEAVVSALSAAHEMDWVHRDVKPANILRLDRSGEEEWVLADWGLGRRPRGETSRPGRTKVGVSYGTEGFAAPELSSDAHEATPAADVYSLGQVIGWALTGTWPQANVSLLPKSGPWRQVVRQATRPEPHRRPQPVHDLLEIISEELDDVPVPPASEGERLIAEVSDGNLESAVKLLGLAESNPEDVELFLDVLPQLSESQTRHAAVADLSTARDIARALQEHLESDWERRDFKWANQVIRFALSLAKVGVRQSDPELLEAASEALFAWDDRWDQWGVQPAVASWLRSLRDEEARVVASVIRPYSDSRVHFEELASDRDVDPRLRQVLGP